MSDYNYCPQCGAALQQRDTFCSHCGAQINTHSKIPSAPVEKESHSGKRVVLSLMILFLICTAFVTGLFIYGKNYYSREKQIDRFVEILSEKDAGSLAKVLSSEDADFYISEESLQPYVDYLGKDRSYEVNLAIFLKICEDDDASKDIYLTKNGKYLFFFDRYKFILNPFYTVIKTDSSDAEITVNDEQVAVSDNEDYEKDIGPLAPGTYEFSAAIQVDGEMVVSSKEVDFVRSSAETDFSVVNLNFNDSALEEHLYFQVSYDNTADDIIQNIAGTEFGSPQYVQGVKNEAIYLDGAHDYIEYGRDLKVPNSSTINIWINSEEPDRYYSNFFTKYETPEHGAYAFSVHQGKINCWINNAQGKDVILDSQTSIEPNRWYMVSIVKDGNSMKLYINGEIDSSFEVENYVENEDMIMVGSQALENNAEKFKGYIDEFSIYDIPLSSNQIQSLFME